MFIGGGTPSLFSAAAIDRLLAGIRARVPLAPDAEITLEANPGTFERAKFAGYRAAGVNRLSLGIQSFDPASLAALGRVHDADEARRAAEAALAIFGNVNFDLMYALPRQTLGRGRGRSRGGARVRAAAPVVLPPDARAEHAVPPVSAAAARRRHGRRHRGRRARDGSTRRGTGTTRRRRMRVPAANAGTISTTGGSATTSASAPARTRSCRSPTASCGRCATSSRSSISTGSPRARRCRRSASWRARIIGFEFMLNALRLTDGVPASLFAERTGYPLALVQRGLAAAEARGLIERDPATIRPTRARPAFSERPAGAVPCAPTREGSHDDGSSRSTRMPLAAAADAIAAGTLTARALADAQLAARRRDRRRDRRLGASRPGSRARRSRSPRCRPARGARPAARHRRRREGHHRDRGSADADGIAGLRGAPAAGGCGMHRPAEARGRLRLRQDGDDGVRVPRSRRRRGIRGIPRHTPGGSSSGSAAAVAAAHVAGAIGTQTNGSVIRPAAYCGVVGFKPTKDAIPFSGVHLFSETLDQLGTFTRTSPTRRASRARWPTPGRIAPARRAHARSRRASPISTDFRGRRKSIATRTTRSTPRRRGCGSTAPRSSPSGFPAPWREAHLVHRTIMLFEAASHLVGAAGPRARAHVAEAQRRARRGPRDSPLRITTPRSSRATPPSRSSPSGSPATTPSSRRRRRARHPRGLATTGDPSCCTLWSLTGLSGVDAADRVRRQRPAARHAARDARRRRRPVARRRGVVRGALALQGASL